MRRLYRLNKVAAPLPKCTLTRSTHRKLSHIDQSAFFDSIVESIAISCDGNDGNSTKRTTMIMSIVDSSLLGGRIEKVSSSDKSWQTTGARCLRHSDSLQAMH
jgi:hypothetical protein